MRTLKIVLPLALIALGALGAWALYAARPAPETRFPEVPVPLVRVRLVELQELQLTVISQGTVSPRTESTLVPEVAGRVIEVAASFESGGFFDKDQVLLQIDSHDYREAVVQAKAAVVQAKLRLAQEKAEAKIARDEWAELGDDEPPPLTARIPQLAEAEAALAASRAALSRAERHLARTSIRAPYDGRVREKLVDVGTYVTPGTRLASVYAVDYAEIRLPLPDADLAYVDLPLVYRDDRLGETGPEVVLRARFAGRDFEWHGRIVRTEGEIDRRSRMVHAVARVKDPYARGEGRRPPLAVGMFVEAEILGRRLTDVARVPRSALREGDRVLIVDDDDRLRFRNVEVLRLTNESAVVGAGLEAGERLCVSPLITVTDGMRVRPVDAESS